MSRRAGMSMALASAVILGYLAYDGIPILLDAVQFGKYKLSGDRPSWRPVRIYDNGKNVYIQFPHDMTKPEKPVLYITDQDGKPAVTNYRISASLYITDILFDVAELHGTNAIVTIERGSR